MATLPWDSIVNILTRLDVKDLLRYRCVSKPWCSLIDGPDFIKMQLKHSMETDSHLSLIRGQSDLHSVDLDALDSAAVRLIPPTNDASRGIVILGHCNGLVAIGYSGMEMGIWNPSTRKLSKVPTSGIFKLPFPECKYTYGLAGFGYDPVNDDHKLFCNIPYYRHWNDGHPFYSEDKVFSVKTQTWKRVGDFPYKGHLRGEGLFAGTCLNWIVGVQLPTKPSLVLVAFDLVTEKYSELSLPGRENEMNMSTRITVFNGWLCWVCKYKKDGMVDRVDIWVLKEHGVKDPWTKLFTVVPSDVTGVFDYLMPLAYLKRTHQVLLNQDGDKLLLYDLERKGAKSVRKISGIPKCYDMFVCVRSLLGVGRDDIGDNNGKKADENENQNEREKQSGKKRDDFLSKGFKLVL